MRQVYYKCLCCGLLGSQEDFGIPLRLERTDAVEFDYCPSCGSINVTPFYTEINVLNEAV